MNWYALAKIVVQLWGAGITVAFIVAAARAGDGMDTIFWVVVAAFFFVLTISL